MVDFLFKIERIWPSDVAPFSIEVSLEILKKNDYNFNKVINLIRFQDSSFKNIINGMINIKFNIKYF